MAVTLENDATWPGYSVNHVLKINEGGCVNSVGNDTVRVTMDRGPKHTAHTSFTCGWEELLGIAGARGSGSYHFQVAVAGRGVAAQGPVTAGGSGCQCLGAKMVQTAAPAPPPKPPRFSPPPSASLLPALIDSGPPQPIGGKCTFIDQPSLAGVAERPTSPPWDWSACTVPHPLVGALPRVSGCDRPRASSSKTLTASRGGSHL